MHTNHTLHSFSILVFPKSPVWESSHPSVSGFLTFLFMPNNLLLPFTTELFPSCGFWLNFPLHSVLHIYLPSQVMLLPSCSPPPPCPSHTCPAHTSCSSLTSFLLLYSLSHKAQLCPCCLHNIILVNIFLSFCPLAGLFHFKGCSVVCLGLLLFGFFKFFFFKEREAETASHQCSSPSKQLIAEPGKGTQTLPYSLVSLDIWLSKQHISARYDTLL